MRLTAYGTRGRRTESPWPGNKHLYVWKRHYRPTYPLSLQREHRWQGGI